MLSQKTIDIVKATVPALKERGVEITQVFYKNMLGENPDIRAMFDPEKQKDGSQPKALAMTVLAAAQNIENLAILAPAVQKIAKTHVNVNVKPFSTKVITVTLSTNPYYRKHYDFRNNYYTIWWIRNGSVWG